MSQPAPAPQAPPAPAPAAPAGPKGMSWPAPAGQPIGHGVVDTPGLLNRWQLIGVALVVVFGLASALIQFLAWQSDGRAADDTDQLVRVQNIQSSLLRADALATNSFLNGGLEDTDQRAEYDEALADVLKQIADAAEAQPLDRAALAALNQDVNDYATAVAQARVNNRQGFPIGATYLSQASAALRSDALPVLDALVKANEDRAEDSMGGQHPWWLLGLGLVVVAGLVWLNQQHAQRFRRRINVGLAVAAGIVVVVTLVTAVLAFARAGSNDDLLAGDFRMAVDQAEARTAANDAKANESLRLINRGSGETYEEPWRTSAAVVEEKASDDTIGDWETYAQRHAEVVELDDADVWRDARLLATDTGKSGSSAPLNDFDEASQTVIKDAAGNATDELRSGRIIALALSFLTLVLGVVAAIAVSRGIGARRREYA